MPKKKATKKNTVKKVAKKQKKPTGKNRDISDKTEEVINRGEVIKIREFRLYVVWKTLPSVMKRLNEEQLQKLGIESEELLELLKIKSQSKFIKTYRLGKNTLSNWNKLITQEEIDVEMKRWMKTLNANVRTALYRRIMKEGDPQAVKLWEKLINNWQENFGLQIDQTVEHKLSPEAQETIDKILKKNSIF